MFGYHAQGVSVSTAVLPEGWRERLVPLVTHATQPGRGWALEAHDCVLSKLVAGREKDYQFASALLDAQVVNAAMLRNRAAMLQIEPSQAARVHSWISAHLGARSTMGVVTMLSEHDEDYFSSNEQWHVDN